MRLLLDGRPLQGPTGGRGVGRYVRELAAGLAEIRSGRDDVVLLVDARDGPVTADLPSGVAAAAVAPPPGPRLFWGRALGPRWLDPLRPDVWHATFLSPPRPPARLPWVATIHDLIPLRHPRSFSRTTHFVFERSLRWCAEATEVIAVSAFTADLVSRMLGVPHERLHVAPPPVDVERMARAPKRAPAGVDRPYVLHVGGFDPLKGVSTLLIPAFASVAERHPDVVLALGGAAGPDRAASESAVRLLDLEDRVIFLGRLGDDELASAVAGSAAVVVSSLEEGFGLPVVEALAAGVPVAVGPAEASREAAGDLGCLAPDPTAAGLARAMEDALASPGPDTPDGEARRRYARRFERTHVAAEVFAIYERAMREA